MRVIRRESVTMVTLIAVIGLLSSNGLSPSQRLSPLNNVDILPLTRTMTRRVASFGILSSFVMGVLHPAVAFDNGIPDMELYRNKTKHPETRPDLLGLNNNGKLASCSDGLNCFSTSGDDAHLLELWKPQKQVSSRNAMTELLETIKTYPPGQAKVDRGGFSIIRADKDYLYVQFESMKHGFIDDVEFATTTDSQGVQVRSSSRLGELDLWVNAKRLNWISAELRVKGWTAPAITKADYPDYFGNIVFTYDDYIRSVLSPEDCPVPALPLSCKDPTTK